MNLFPSGQLAQIGIRPKQPNQMGAYFHLGNNFSFSFVEFWNHLNVFRYICEYNWNNVMLSKHLEKISLWIRLNTNWYQTNAYFFYFYSVHLWEDQMILFSTDKNSLFLVKPLEPFPILCNSRICWKITSQKRLIKLFDVESLSFVYFLRSRRDEWESCVHLKWVCE